MQATQGSRSEVAASTREPTGVEAPAALVLAEHALIATLLGGLVESAGYRLCFAAAGECAHDAVERLRPTLVLLDVAHGAAGDDATYRGADAAGCALVLFGPGLPLLEVARLALARGAGAFDVPAEYGVLRDTLAGTSAGARPAYPGVQ